MPDNRTGAPTQAPTVPPRASYQTLLAVDKSVADHHTRMQAMPAVMQASGQQSFLDTGTPKVVGEQGFGPNAKVVSYDDGNRKAFQNDHQLAAIGEHVPSLAPGKPAFAYTPAPGMEHVENPLWGSRGTDLNRDAARFKGVRTLVYDQATGLTHALFNDPSGGPVYYDSALRHASAPVAGGVSAFSAGVQGLKSAFGDAGADIKRGAPILGQKIKDVAVGTGKTIGGVLDNSGSYVYDRLQQGKAIMNNDPESARQYEQDEQARIAYLHNLADVLTPGTLKDLANSAGSASGGDRRAALHTIQGIGHNYVREMHENPGEFAMNAASVILPVGGAALKAAVDMDKLATAYTAVKDVELAQKARAWAKVYRERAALKAAEEPVGLSMGRSRPGEFGPHVQKPREIHIGPDKPYPNTGNDGTLIGPRPVGISRRWTEHDYTTLIAKNEKGQMIGFGKLRSGLDGETDPYGNIVINDDLRGSPEKVTEAIKHEKGHRVFAPGGWPGLIQDVRAAARDLGWQHSHAMREIEEKYAESRTGASAAKAQEHSEDSFYKINPKRVAFEKGMFVAGGGGLGNVAGNYAVDAYRHRKARR